MPTTTKGIVCLGIDPGIGRLGWGVVSQTGGTYTALAYGCLETPPHEETPIRIKALYDGVREQIERCSPHFMSVERLYFGQNRTTAEAVWQARGAVLLLSAQYDLPLVEPKPSEVPSRGWRSRSARSTLTEGDSHACQHQRNCHTKI